MSDSNPRTFELSANTRTDEGEHKFTSTRGIYQDTFDLGLNELLELQRVVDNYVNVVIALPLITGIKQADEVIRQWMASGCPPHPFAGLEHERYCRRCAGGRDGIQHPVSPS